MEKETLLEARVHGDSMFPFRLYMVDYLDGNVIFNMHWHHEIEFIYVEKGPIHFQIGTKQYTLAEGSGFFIPSEQLHGAYPSGNSSFKLHAIVFHIDLLRSFGYDLIESNYLEAVRNFSVFHSTLLTPDNKDDRDMLHILRNIVETHSSKTPSFELKLKGYLFLLFSEIFRKKAWKNNEEISKRDITKTELLKRVLQYIEKHYKQKITVLELASQIQMSEGHFSRFFKSLVRMTPMEYINNIRISKACILIEKTNRKMLDIALDVGFTNQSYFIRLFKKQKGCTPKEFKLKLDRESLELGEK
ncbi:AraC family transcriptional regulator [Lederbergia lenta]|uniref:AraC family transcriptional regulator n=1 Tax=Lederbergia lenta TaxID=1467 RepID=UPI00203CCAA2|nr:AraC family transcriptional regulator [Lederbergia lenta]